MEQIELPIRNAGLYSALRSFIIAACALLRADRESGADVTFGVTEHRDIGREGSPLYEFRPQVEGFVRERLGRIGEMPETVDAAWTVSSDPATSAFLRAGRADTIADLESIARSEVLVPLLLAITEARPDFEIDEDLLLANYLRFERALYAEQRRYVAAVPVWGVRLECGDLRLADGVTLRTTLPDEFRLEWPEAAQLNWSGDGRTSIPTVLLQFDRTIGVEDPGSIVDPVPAIDQVISVIRVLAGGSICAGPQVLERLDYRALAPRPVSALSARRCGVMPSRIDTTMSRVLPDALSRLASDPNGSVARALERYQLAVSTKGMVALRAVYDAIIDIYATRFEPSAAGLRLAAVVAASLPERRQFIDSMEMATNFIFIGDRTAVTSDLVRALAAGLRATIAAGLVGEVPLHRLREYADDLLIGERERKRLGVSAMKPIMT